MSAKAEARLSPTVSEAPLSDTVFHLTPEVNAPEIFKKGLLPYPGRGKEESWRLLERFMDDIRPEHIQELGITRRQGIFAYPDIEVLKPRYLGEREYAKFVRRPQDDTAFAIDVDPEKVMVFDMGDLVGIQSRLSVDSGLEHISSDPRAVELGLRYWNNGLTLKEFRQRYETRHDLWSSTTSLRQEYHDVLADPKYAYRTPEVIVPGPISPESIYWAASKLTLLDLDQAK